MTKKTDNTGYIMGVISVLFLSIGGYLYFRKPSTKEEVPSMPIIPSVESGNIKTPPTLASTNPTGSTTTSSAKKPVYVYATANGAIVYKGESSNGIVNVIGAKVRTVNKGDKIGVLIGNRDIQNYTYMLAKDINSGLPVFIAKSVSKTDF